MQFDHQTTQYISTNFFEAEAKDKANYKAIRTIFALFIYYPFAAFSMVTFFAWQYSYKIAVYVTKYIMAGNSKLSSKEHISNFFISFYENIANCCGQKNNSEKEKDKRRIRILGISIAFVLLTFALYAFQIMACVKLIRYGNEVLYQHDDYKSPSFDSGTDRGITIAYVVVSLYSGLLIIISSMAYHGLIIYRLYSKHADKTSGCADNTSGCAGNTSGSAGNTSGSAGNTLGDSAKETQYDGDQILGAFAQVSLGGFIGYLGFYFAPYMLLAFINDPIRTSFIYIIGALFIFCSYLLIEGFLANCKVCLTDSRKQNCCSLIKKMLFAVGTATSLAYFLTIVIFLFMLGNFSDFQAVHNLTLPLIIFLIPVLVFKPLYRNIFNPSKKNNANSRTTVQHRSSLNETEL